ncbi:phage major capsid protein [Brevundimonas sp. WCHBH090558]|uniref:phage major capsid protein n=1 Tax=Brevundimonas huaxiensis TaxID=2725493 RepID=UPI0016238023|nr:phage major capsid protein [Brevundimonas huaxiensis]MBC1183741.1 phage major capsid protein [Brevundimonas huaxiensis]
MPNLPALQERRASVADKLTEIRTAAAGREFTDAELSEIETKRPELDDLDRQIRSAQFLADAERTAPAMPINDNVAPEIRSQSISETLLYKVDPGALSSEQRAKVEREQAFLERRAGRKANGAFIATEVFETRATQTTGTSAAIVPESFRPDLFTSALTASTVLQSLGATVLTGLTGNVVIPRETGSPNVGWVAEDQALPTGNATFDNVTLTPHHVGAITELSRQLLMQSSPAVDGIIRQMLSRNIALEIDRAALNGSGVGAEPRGLLNDPGVAAVPFATDLFTTTADMIAAADLANVSASRGFLATNGIKASAMKLRTTDGLPIPWAATFHGEPVQFSNQAPNDLGADDDEHALAYGDWSDFLVGIWSQLDILVNPYAETAYSKGNVLIRAMATVDFGVRRPASFVKASGVTVA